MNIINYNGPITISTTEDPTAENITISIRLRASNQEQLNNYKTIFYIENQKLFFQEVPPSDANFLEKILPCMAAEIEVGIPVYSKIPTIIVNTMDGNIGLSTSSKFPMSSIQLSSTNGDIYLSSFNSYSIKTSTTNGNSNLQNLISGQISVSSTNGKIEFTNIQLLNVTNPSISGSTTNGNVYSSQIEVANSSQIDFTSTNGNIDTQLNHFSGNFDAQTTNGPATVNGQNINYSTNNWNHKQGTVGTGMSTCDLKTTNGGITLSFN